MRGVSRLSDLIRAHIEKTDPRRIFIDKVTTRKVAEKAGVALPQLLQLYKSVDEIELNPLPDRFVLKPTHFAAKQGVYLLNRTGDGYFDMMSRRSLTGSEILDEIRALIGKKRTDIIAEELVIGENGPAEIPYDYKVYAFDDATPLIVQIDRNVAPLGITLLDEGFNQIAETDARLCATGCQMIPPVRPRNAEAILEACRILLRAADRPFMRIDLYTTGERVILGELTPSPGAPYYGSPYFFSPAFDTRLGSMVLEGYRRRGWEVPEIEGIPPSRRLDGKFATAAG